ncbi:hypothetical protein TRFO_36262 [Tritrichomonas foetus]|uniref:Uncharacterized protein n=1 Tax=Tritrichomonas foetus TaxID=1144522 RepID=A0A1J4JIX9_9EUKA|nr:hypothetical protein TRFO_36262 [Tritrichomonas foetus]|eukprot:OHS97509.1 hypothetical protein TRFO_36262 [Tritrichomonas foetus]
MAEIPKCEIHITNFDRSSKNIQKNHRHPKIPLNSSEKFWLIHDVNYYKMTFIFISKSFRSDEIQISLFSHVFSIQNRELYIIESTCCITEGEDTKEFSILTEPTFKNSWCKLFNTIISITYLVIQILLEFFPKNFVEIFNGATGTTNSRRTAFGHAMGYPAHQ